MNFKFVVGRIRYSDDNEKFQYLDRHFNWVNGIHNAYIFSLEATAQKAAKRFRGKLVKIHPDNLTSLVDRV